MKESVVVYDPLFPQKGLSHHYSVRNFIESLSAIDIVYSEEQYLAYSRNNCRLLRRYLTGFYLLRKAVVFCLVHRKSLKHKAIFLPHSDIVSTLTLLILRKLGLIDVKFIIRSIGIQDFSTIGGKKHFLVKRFLNIFLESNDKISAETRALCRKMRTIQNRVISIEHTPYPGFINCVKGLEPSSNEKMLFIGNPREDKGYADVLKLARDFPNIKLRIQLPQKNNFQFQNDVMKVRQLPNVEFFETPATESEIMAEVASAHGLLMPYSKSSFEERGSGILIAGILMRKNIYGFRRTSLEEECSGFTAFHEWKDISLLPSLDSTTSGTVNQEYLDYITTNWKRLLS